MVTLDQVEKLRKRANISYDEAKAALEDTDGDLLEAIINLEKENRIKSPEDGGYFNSREYHNEKQKKSYSNTESSHYADPNSSIKEFVRKFVKWCRKMIGKGNRNYFEVFRHNEKTISFPVTVLVISLCFAFWIVVPLIVVGLFFGYRYAFNGPDLGKDNINRAMNSVADAAESFKNEVKGEKSYEEDSDN